MRRKFKLPKAPGTTLKNVRFPNGIIKGVEKSIHGTNVSFSTFVSEATRLLLEEWK